MRVFIEDRILAETGSNRHTNWQVDATYFQTTKHKRICRFVVNRKN